MKIELRKKVIKIRGSLDIAKISELICQKILAMPAFINAENVGIFYPKKIEINLLPLCSISDKNFYLPRIKGDLMEFYKFSDETLLKKGKFGILEPNLTCEKGFPDLIITPALCADYNGFRLGWGKGFYDRYLKTYKKIVICPVPDCLIYDDIYAEKHDIKCDFIVSERRIIKIS